MSVNLSAEDASQHHVVSALIPWYVNATLAEHDRQKVEAHVELCATCREDLLVQQRIFEAIDGETAIEYLPKVSLKRFQARLDALQADTTTPEAAQVDSNAGNARWRGLVAVSIAAMAITISLLIADRWVQWRAPLAAANFRTVTAASVRPHDEVIRAVFSPTITLVELQAILEESQLRIISGPSEAGVYSLAANSNRSVDSSLALLRRHDSVRFAEETRPEAGPDAAP